MKLSELLREGQILTGFRAKDRWETIGLLAELLASQGRLAPEQRAPVLDALLAREKIASTGLEHGVALPHAPVEILEETLAVLAVSPEGIPFQSADGQPARIVALLAFPRRRTHEHSALLASTARLLSYEDTREALLRVHSPREALQAVRDAERA